MSKFRYFFHFRYVCFVDLSLNLHFALYTAGAGILLEKIGFHVNMNL